MIIKVLLIILLSCASVIASASSNFEAKYSCRMDGVNVGELQITQRIDKSGFDFDVRHLAPAVRLSSTDSIDCPVSGPHGDYEGNFMFVTCDERSISMHASVGIDDGGIDVELQDGGITIHNYWTDRHIFGRDGFDQHLTCLTIK